MQTAFEGTVPVAYGQAYLHLQGSADYSGEVRKGQVNGLLGAAVPTALFLTFGLHTGEVKLTIKIADAEPPLDEHWEEAVEASFTMPRSAVLGLADWEGGLWRPVPLKPGSYRVRYTALRFGEAENAPTPDDDADPIEQYEVVFWPAASAPDAILKVTRPAAQYWHDAARRSAQSAEIAAADHSDVPFTPTTTADQSALHAAAAPTDQIDQAAPTRDPSFEHSYRELMMHIHEVVPVEKKTEVVSISDAFARVTAEPVTARENVPNINIAVTDGWAIRSADTATASRASPCRLRRSFINRDGPMTEGDAANVCYGMPMPEGSDAVIARFTRDYQEYAEPSEICIEHFASETVKVFAPIPAGSGVLRAGKEIEQGQVIAKVGVRLTSTLIASALAAGVQTVRVFARPRVSIFSVPAFGDWGRDDLAYANRRNPACGLLQTNLRHWNANVVGTLEVPSERHAAASITAVARALIEQSDLAITTGANGSRIRSSGYGTRRWTGANEGTRIRLSYMPRCSVQVARCHPRAVSQEVQEILDEDGRLRGSRMVTKSDHCAHVQLIGGIAATQLMTQLVLKPLIDALEGVQDPKVDWQTGILSMDYNPAPGLPDSLIWMHATVRDDGSTALQPVRVAEFSGTDDANAVAVNPDAGPLTNGAVLKYLRV